mgnify:CR=1 FL=1
MIERYGRAWFSILLGFVIGVFVVAGCGSSSGGGGGTTTPAGATTAADWLFSNAVSAITATDVQDALDEVEARLDIAENPAAIGKYTQTGLSLALNTPVTVTHNLNTTSPVVSLTITGGGVTPTSIAETNYTVVNANSIQVWQGSSGSTYTADVVVIAP